MACKSEELNCRAGSWAASRFRPPRPTLVAILMHFWSTSPSTLVQAQSVQHPVGSAVVMLPSKQTSLSARPPSTGSAASAMANRLTSATVQWTLGRADGGGSDVFGNIVDVTLQPSGSVIVLDNYNNEVRIFDPTGRYLSRVGRPGRGPGEFYRPLAVGVDGDGQLLVTQLDRSISVFVPSGDDYNYTFSTRLTTVVSGRDLCALRHIVYLQGAPSVGGPTIFPVGDGAPSPFGEFYRSNNPIIASEVNQGLVACHDSLSIVVAAPKSLLGLVYAFSASGSPKWIARITGFRPVNLVENADRSTRVTIPEQGFHRVESLVPIGDRWLLLQLALVTPESSAAKDPPVRIDSYLIEASTGEGAHISSRLPQIAAADEKGFLAIEHLPFPRLLRYQWTSGS